MLFLRLRISKVPSSYTFTATEMIDQVPRMTAAIADAGTVPGKTLVR